MFLVYPCLGPCFLIELMPYLRKMMEKVCINKKTDGWRTYVDWHFRHDSFSKSQSSSDLEQLMIWASCCHYSLFRKEMPSQFPRLIWNSAAPLWGNIHTLQIGFLPPRWNFTSRSYLKNHLYNHIYPPHTITTTSLLTRKGRETAATVWGVRCCTRRWILWASPAAVLLPEMPLPTSCSSENHHASPTRKIRSKRNIPPMNCIIWEHLGWLWSMKSLQFNLYVGVSK